MPISDYFSTRDHVKEVIDLHINFNQTTGLIVGGNVRADLCDLEGENVQKTNPIPFSTFTVTPTEKSTLESFINKITTELRTAAGKSIYEPPPPEPEP